MYHLYSGNHIDSKQRRNAAVLPPPPIDRRAEALRRNRELDTRDSQREQRERKLKIQLPPPERVQRSGAMRDLHRKRDDDLYIDLF